MQKNRSGGYILEVDLKYSDELRKMKIQKNVKLIICCQSIVVILQMTLE